MTPATANRAGRSIPWLVIAGVLVAALSLRGPIVAPTPVLRDIETDLGLTSATVALLTTAPVLMFALLTPLAALVIRRAGAEVALLISLSGVLVGTFVRALPGFGWMLAGMIVIGAAITVGNVVVPVIVRRDVPPEHVSTTMAGYVAMLNAGSLLTTLFTAPAASLVGWPLALLTWSVMSMAGIVLWGVHLRRRRARSAGGAPSPREQPSPGEIDPRTLTGPTPVVARGGQVSFLRNPVAWLLTLAFACQAFMYYGLTTWLPALSADVLAIDRVGAGAMASVFQGVAVIGAFIVPVVTRFAPAWVSGAVIAVAWMTVTAGLLVAPSLIMLWLVVGAVAHSGGFVVVFSALVRASRSDGEAAGMSALVQGGGYALGAAAGPVIGGLFEATGSWTAGLAVLVVAAGLYGVLLMAAFAAARSAR